jgi:hypothetical protein
VRKLPGNEGKQTNSSIELKLALLQNIEQKFVPYFKDNNVILNDK